MSTAALAFIVLESVALATWLFVLVGRAGAWRLEPRADEGAIPFPSGWPAVHVLVPARNEQATLPSTLPALLEQDYPGLWRVILVDDRSSDGTADLATSYDPSGTRLRVVVGEPLPEAWAGKVWALEQGARASLSEGEQPAYLLLTDADIRHAPGSLRRLVAESVSAELALNSRMARLRCVSRPERLLIPPFLFFFNLLFPMRRVNDPASTMAAAAGGCVLLAREALEKAGGFSSIRSEVIDDVNLAHQIKSSGGRIRLSLSLDEVASTREYGSVSAVWRMVRRTAFDQLGYSWGLLAVTILALCVLFVAPPIGVLLGVGTAVAHGLWAWGVVAGIGFGAWLAATAAYVPSVRYFELSLPWSLTLPLAGILYGGMTVDSAARTARGRERW